MQEITLIGSKMQIRILLVKFQRLHLLLNRDLWAQNSEKDFNIPNTRGLLLGRKLRPSCVWVYEATFINSSGPNRSVLGSNWEASCPRENIFMGNVVVSQESVMCSKLA